MEYGVLRSLVVMTRTRPRETGYRAMRCTCKEPCISRGRGGGGQETKKNPCSRRVIISSTLLIVIGTGREKGGGAGEEPCA